LSNIALGVIVIAAVAAAIAIFVYYRKRYTERLRKHFGAEYDRTVEAKGNQREAEKELEAREKRVESFKIRSLVPEDRNRYAEAWKVTQKRFVDQPTAAVREADDLVQQVMRARGYPVADFEQRIADISVHHPRVVHNYRIARDIAERNRKGEATTEDLRQALVAYRDLFVDLLDEEVPSKKQKQQVVKEDYYNESRNKREYRQ
jgi:hypothetical protein